MSDWKRSYGWFGHILVDRSETDGSERHNVVAVPTETFERIAKDYENCKLDERIHAERLGVIDSEYYFLAVGTGFSEGFEYYGTVFQEAEVRCTPGPLAYDADEAYLNAMKELYSLILPKSQFMIGCSSEH